MHDDGGGGDGGGCGATSSWPLLDLWHVIPLQSCVCVCIFYIIIFIKHEYMDEQKAQPHTYIDWSM